MEATISYNGETIRFPHFQMVDTSPQISLNEGEIQTLWEIGVIPDKTYLYFILKMLFRYEWNDRLKNGKVFPEQIDISAADISYIRHNWSTERKQLTEKLVVNAIVALTNLKESKCMSVVKQLSLLDAGALF